MEPGTGAPPSIILRGLALNKRKEIAGGHVWHHMDWGLANTIQKSLVKKCIWQVRIVTLGVNST